jgi:hypothetical protein
VPSWRRKSRRSSPGSLERPAPRRLSLRPRGFGRQQCPPLFEFGQIKGRFRFVPLIDMDLSGLVADPHRAGREWFEVHHLRRPTGIVGDEIQGDEPVDRFDVLEDEESALAAISRGPSRVTERLLRGQCGKTGIDQTSSIRNTPLARLKFLSLEVPAHEAGTARAPCMRRRPESHARSPGRGRRRSRRPECRTRDNAGIMRGSFLKDAALRREFLVLNQPEELRLPCLYVCSMPVARRRP